MYLSCLVSTGVMAEAFIITYADIVISQAQQTLLFGVL
jgi:choline kinase